MLELRSVEFRQGDFALRADWSLADGTRLAVIGPSGGGKSTLLAGIAGFVAQTGEVMWNGQPMAVSPDARPVAMLFQDHNLFPHLTVAQNVGLGLRPTLSLGTEERDRVEAALSAVGLAGMGARRPAELSGGQQSRAALARILLMGRPIILLDEPFAALGPTQRAEMLALVEEVAGRLQATLIMVTHDPAEAEALGGLVSFVEDGVARPPVEARAFFDDPPEGMRSYAGGGLRPRDP